MARDSWSWGFLHPQFDGTSAGGHVDDVRPSWVQGHGSSPSAEITTNSKGDLPYGGV